MYTSHKDWLTEQRMICPNPKFTHSCLHCASPSALKGSSAFTLARTKTRRHQTRRGNTVSGSAFGNCWAILTTKAWRVLQPAASCCAHVSRCLLLSLTVLAVCWCARSLLQSLGVLAVCSCPRCCACCISLCLLSPAMQVNQSDFGLCS